MEILVVIDMQNDFIDGALKNDDAKAIVEPMADYIKKYSGGMIIFTRDTHDAETYPNSQEGRKLPVPHCIKGTDGWRINKYLWDAAEGNKNAEVRVLNKPTFGYGFGFRYLLSDVDEDMITKITLVGTCTSICVAANAIILKSIYPEIEIQVESRLCSDINLESHNAALLVMSNQQITILK